MATVQQQGHLTVGSIFILIDFLFLLWIRKGNSGEIEECVRQQNKVSTTHPFKVLIAALLYFASIRIDCDKDNPPCNKPPTDIMSHAWTFTNMLPGDGASSCLYDVAIINDLLAYVVGSIYSKGNLGNWDSLPINSK